MKKKKLIILITFLSLCLFSISFTGYYIYTGIQNRNKCEATYIKDEEGTQIGISYNGRNYYDFDYMREEGFYGPHILDRGSIPYPYDLVVSEEEKYSEYIYIEQEKFSDYALWFDRYFYYFSETYDKNRDFIVYYDYEMHDVYVDENFVFPTIYENEIDEVWMSASSDDEDNITDKKIVDKIVECAKSNGTIELEKEIADYIKKYSWDHHCFNLKYKGYPLTEDFHIVETEDGRYTIGKYTLEEYDTIYQDDPAHQW